MTKKVPPNKKGKFIPRNFASEIKALVMDFDGVLTDNKVIVNEDGSESVVCSRDDGYAIEKIKELGIITLILTREKNNVVIARARKLNTEIIKGEKEKLEKLKKWCLKNNIFPEGLAYIGNDLPDIEEKLIPALSKKFPSSITTELPFPSSFLCQTSSCIFDLSSNTFI